MSLQVSTTKSADSSNISKNRTKLSRASRVSIKELLKLSDQTEVKDVGPHPLSSECIMLRGRDAEKLLSTEKNLVVPPSSPKSKFIFDRKIDTIPVKLRSAAELKVPFVRVLGIKKTIDILGEFFGCTLYKTSLLQFWFLDMVADCLWKCQDEFLLNEKYQKAVLNWILYFFDIIRNPLYNLSRRQFYQLFRETLVLVEERIECGDSYFPSPEEVFTLKMPTEKSKDFDAVMSDSTDSSLSSDNSDSDCSFLVMPSEEYQELPDFYRLPCRECKCDISITSSIETLSEKSIYIDEETHSEDDPHFNSEAEVEKTEAVAISDFYQPKAELHSRFLDVLDGEEEDSIGADPKELQENEDVEYEWVNETDQIQPTTIENIKSTPTISVHEAASVMSNIRKIRSSSTKSKVKPERKSTQDDTASIQTLTFKKPKLKAAKEEKKQTEKDMLKAWFEYNLLEQRKEDMANPNKGWKPYEPEICSDDCICSQIEYTAEDFRNEEYLRIKNEWLQYLEKYKLAIKQNNQNIFINSCLLLIIKQFIFEYFYESFQYKLVKMTYQMVPNLTCEKLNEKWNIPKHSREEFRRPLEKKPKPPKPVKEKSPKAKKHKEKEKGEKKAKHTEKTHKTMKKAAVKPDKPHKTTKEEKQELERAKREEEQKIRDEIAAEENRRFIFPLGLAANEQFLKSIFEDYGKDIKSPKKK